MGQRDQPDDDTVTVHVTPRGGLYLNERELLRSKAAQETMDRMDRVMAELTKDMADWRDRRAAHRGCRPSPESRRDATGA